MKATGSNVPFPCIIQQKVTEVAAKLFYFRLNFWFTSFFVVQDFFSAQKKEYSSINGLIPVLSTFKFPVIFDLCAHSKDVAKTFSWAYIYIYIGIYIDIPVGS